MSLPEKDDREISGKALGLDEDHIAEISRLKTGEAIVYQTGWEEPVKTKISLFENESTTWTYSRADASERETKIFAIQELFKILYDKYTGAIDVIDIPVFMDLLKKFGLSGGRMHSIIDKYNSTTDISSDDVAYVFATIVGPEIFDSLKSIPDLGVLNVKLGRSLNQFAGLSNDSRTMTFINMYLKGCSLKSATPFYDTWLSATLKEQ